MVNITQLVIKNYVAPEGGTLSEEQVSINTASLNALTSIFNSTANPVSCDNYGEGDHCTDSRSETKLKIWGKRGAESGDNACMVARVHFVDGQAAALINIGLTGNSITDKSEQDHEHKVYEFSGIVLADPYFLDPANKEKTEMLGKSILTALKQCNVGTEFSKAFVSFKVNHPYQQKFFESIGGKVLTQENVKEILGENSMHPGRFTFENGKSFECSKWWEHPTECTNGTEKTFMVVDIIGEHFDVHEGDDL